MEATAANNPEHLVRNRDYSQTWKTSSFTADPVCVHFGGFTCGRTHVSHVRLINTSRSAAGLHVLPSTDPAFKYSVVNEGREHGAVVSGMSIRVRVEFKPTQSRHYDSAIRIHCGVRLSYSLYVPRGCPVPLAAKPNAMLCVLESSVFCTSL